MSRNIYLIGCLFLLLLNSACTHTDGLYSNVLNANVEQSVVKQLNKEIPRNLNDSLISMLAHYKGRHPELPQGDGNYKFWPVLSKVGGNKDVNTSVFSFSDFQVTHREFICLDRKSNVYYSLRFEDNSNAKINQEFYDATVKAYGQEFADKAVKAAKQNKWVVGHFSSTSPVVLEIQEALKNVNSKDVFFYRSIKTLKVGFVKKGKAYSCVSKSR